MLTQFGNLLTTSFLLWADDRLCRVGDAVKTGRSQIFEYSDAVDTPSGFNSFFAPTRQFCAGHELSPSGIFVNGTGVYQNETNGTKMLIDHNQGRILLDSSYGTDVVVSGNFVEKEINVYETELSQEAIVANPDFYLEDGQTSYRESVNENSERRYALPALFITDVSSKNKGAFFGGVKKSTATIRMLFVGESKYQLDAVLSLFADANELTFPIMPYDDFPYGEFWQVKQPPYSYLDLATGSGVYLAMIRDVVTYRMKDSAQQRLAGSRSLQFGFIDVQVEVIRNSGQAFNETRINRKVRFDVDSEGRLVIIVNGEVRGTI